MFSEISIGYPHHVWMRIPPWRGGFSTLIAISVFGACANENWNKPLVYFHENFDDIQIRWEFELQRPLFSFDIGRGGREGGGGGERRGFHYRYQLMGHALAVCFAHYPGCFIPRHSCISSVKGEERGAWDLVVTRHWVPPLDAYHVPTHKGTRR